MLHRIILGTANFAQEYNGVKVNDVDAILDYCQKVGVFAIDTAFAYNTQHLEYPRKIVKVGKADYIFGEAPLVIMSHSMEAYSHAIVLAKEMKTNLGASIYIDDVDAMNGWSTIPRVIQLPYSVLDRRFETYLHSINRAGTQIHARSVFGNNLKVTDPFKALMFVLANQCIDKVVIGTESLQMLQDTLEPLIELDKLKSEDGNELRKGNE